MLPVEITHVAKNFGTTKAVEDVSFEVYRGEIFGLLGPNGAGKTTTIRMLLDIFKPDSGTVSILGGTMSDEKKRRIGYLPEERGLYQESSLEDCLLFFASLKGVKTSVALPRLKDYLERFDLAGHRKKKVKELSKGMQQKAQVISTILHEPELVIIDEPFTALDPINTQLVRDLMQELRQNGATIIMSTHQMHQVEELCDRIVLIDRGKNVLYGNLAEIRRNYATGEVILNLNGSMPDLQGVYKVVTQNGGYRLTLEQGVEPGYVLEELVSQHVQIDKYEIAMPSLDEIFVQIVKKQVEVE